VSQEDNIEIYLIGILCEGMEHIQLAQDSADYFEDGNETSSYMNGRENI
jgi:hypothetical protein